MYLTEDVDDILDNSKITKSERISRQTSEDELYPRSRRIWDTNFRTDFLVNDGSGPPGTSEIALEYGSGAI